MIVVCVLAAFADGSQSEVERTQIKRTLERFSDTGFDPTSACEEAAGRRPPLAEVVRDLQGAEARTLAYEMAVCVCNADGVLTDAEKTFLATLHEALDLDPEAAPPVLKQAHALVREPLGVTVCTPDDSSREAELDNLILHTAILNGALELLPHALATMAIIPLQMRMVYRIGKQYGFELDRGHVKDFLATVGVGLTSQVIEGFARKLMANLTRRVGGRLAGGLAGQATSSAFAFGTTYALGHLAKRYYSTGRTLDRTQLKQVFSTLLGQAGSLRARHLGDIEQASKQVNVSQLLPLLRSN